MTSIKDQDGRPTKIDRKAVDLMYGKDLKEDYIPPMPEDVGDRAAILAAARTPEHIRAVLRAWYPEKFPVEPLEP